MIIEYSKELQREIDRLSIYFNPAQAEKVKELIKMAYTDGYMYG